MRSGLAATAAVVLLLAFASSGLCRPSGQAEMAAASEALAAGRYGEAEAIYRRLAAAEPGLLAAHQGLARALAEQDRRGEAAAHLLRVARGELERGARPAAAALARLAVEIAPGDGSAHALLGRIEAVERRYQAAEASLRRAVELGVRDLPTLLYLGSALWENGHPAEAEKTYEEALSRHGRTPLLLHQTGRLLLWMGRFEEARALLEEALAAGGSGPDLTIDLAGAVEGCGDAAAALAAWSAAAAAAPEHSGVRYALARQLSRAGLAEEAEAELELYRRLYEEDQERTRQEGLEQARIERGVELVRAGEPGRAVEFLSSLPVSPDTLVVLASAYRALGEPQRAVDSLERAVSLAPRRDDLRALLNEARLALGSAP